MQKRQLVTIALAALLLTAACAQAELPAKPAAKPAQPAPATKQEQASDQPATENRTLTTSPSFKDGPPVQIVLVHYRGTLVPLGCCNNLLYERDEYVAIQNVSNSPQDIRGWTLTNLTKGYPAYTFPSLFPCIPRYEPVASAGAKIFNAHNKYVQNPAESVQATFTRPATSVEEMQAEIDWSRCETQERLDETPLEPVGREASQPAPCILYPGETILVFTDEIHCQYGGFSFRYGLGNIWSNQKPDTAVLYNEKGIEVSRRSYFTGR